MPIDPCKNNNAPSNHPTHPLGLRFLAQFLTEAVGSRSGDVGPRQIGFTDNKVSFRVEDLSEIDVDKMFEVKVRV